MEHSISPRLEAKMLEMIGDVHTCPHGHPIGDQVLKGVAQILREKARDTDPDERDFDEVWVFENPDGVTTERWFHAAGCRRWLTVRRDTSIDRVLEVR